MELEHSFTVPAGVEQAWQTLLDVERIAPCMPGATLESVDGDEFTGKVKVKVGPIQITYSGKARFADRDDAAHTVVIEASGKETRGAGTAKATVHTALASQGESQTRVVVRTDLAVTGRPAQFGRGVMNDVGDKLIGQFADCLATRMGEAVPAPGEAEAPGPVPVSAETLAEAGGAGMAGDAGVGGRAAEPGAAAEAAAGAGAGVSGTTGAGPTAGPAAPVGAVPPQAEPRPTAEAIDLLGTAGWPVLKRLGPVLAALVVLFVVWGLVRRRRERDTDR